MFLGRWHERDALQHTGVLVCAEETPQNITTQKVNTAGGLRSQQCQQCETVLGVL